MQRPPLIFILPPRNPTASTETDAPAGCDDVNIEGQGRQIQIRPLLLQLYVTIAIFRF